MRGSGHARYHHQNVSISCPSRSPRCPGYDDHCRSPFPLVIVYHGKRPGRGQERGSIINVTYHRDRTSPALISPYSGNCLTPGAYDARPNKSVGMASNRMMRESFASTEFAGMRPSTIRGGILKRGGLPRSTHRFGAIP